MHTYLIGDDEVRRYGADFMKRLEGLGASTPEIWFSLGVSGDKIAAEFIRDHAGSPALPTQLIRVGYDRKNKTVGVRDGGPIPDDLTDKPILIIDAAIHSGASMRHLADELSRHKANCVLSYSLVVKKTSEFIPNYFGLVIEEHDRVYFQLDQYPNNRLKSEAPFGNLRLLREEDVHRIPGTLTCGVPSIDKTSMADLWYSTRTQNALVYVYEICNEIVGFVHFKHQNSGKLFLDLIACDRKVQDKKVGGLLMRWVETFARSSKCTAIELWSISDRVGWYEKHGYNLLGEAKLDLGGGEVYEKMSRRILYNVKPIELLTVS